MKNKPDLALLQTSYLSKEVKKRILNSYEAIPLNELSVSKFTTSTLYFR
jgi:hypothetical protein